MTEDLMPCPFCGAGSYDISESRLPPKMSGPGALISVTIRHWCDHKNGVRRTISVTGRDREDAREQWNTRA